MADVKIHGACVEPFEGLKWAKDLCSVIWAECPSQSWMFQFDVRERLEMPANQYAPGVGLKLSIARWCPWNLHTSLNVAAC